MAPGPSRSRAILLVAVLLPAAGAWLLWMDEGHGSDIGVRAPPERAATRPPHVATIDPSDSGPSAERRAAAARTGAGGAPQVSVWVSVSAEPGARGAAVVAAGDDADLLQERGAIGIGESKEWSVSPSTRLWHVQPVGRAASFYEPVELRHDPGQGPLTVRLARGGVSVRARAQDETGRTVAGVTLLLGEVHPPRLGAPARKTDAEGEVQWLGLVRAIPALPGVAVHAGPVPDGFEPGATALVVWDEDRVHGEATLVLRRTGMRVALPRVALAGGSFLEKQNDTGTWAHDGWPGRLVQTSESRTTLLATAPLTLAGRGLVPGTYRITLRGRDGTLRRAVFALTEGTLATVSAFETLQPETVPGRLTGPGIGRLRHLVLTDGALRSRLPSEGRWKIPVAADGTFAVPRLEGLRNVRLARLDLSNDAFVVPGVLPLESGQPIVVATVLGVRAAGTVRDARGLPVRDALVHAIARPSNQAAWQRSHPDWFEERVEFRTRTDGMGRFESGPGLPGAWVFSVQRAARAPRVQFPSPIAVTATSKVPVVLTLP